MIGPGATSLADIFADGKNAADGVSTSWNNATYRCDSDINQPRI